MDVLTRNLFNRVGDEVEDAPATQTYRCSRNVRPSITFNPADRNDTQKAIREARDHPINRVCQNCNDPCMHRRLDDGDIDKLLATFKISSV